jgi:hypothetical protein
VIRGAFLRSSGSTKPQACLLCRALVRHRRLKNVSASGLVTYSFLPLRHTAPDGRICIASAAGGSST